MTDEELKAKCEELRDKYEMYYYGRLLTEDERANHSIYGYQLLKKLGCIDENGKPIGLDERPGGEPTEEEIKSVVEGLGLP